MTQMMTVFRVEDADGRGPYRMYDERYDVSLALSHAHSDFPYLHRGETVDDVDPERILHPGPDEDPTLRKRYSWDRHGNFLFAFPSIDHLRRWFSDDVVALADMRCQVSELTVVQRSTVIGEYQAIYNPKRAQLVRTLSLDEVFGNGDETK